MSEFFLCFHFVSFSFVFFFVFLYKFTFSLFAYGSLSGNAMFVSGPPVKAICTSAMKLDPRKAKC